MRRPRIILLSLALLLAAVPAHAIVGYGVGDTAAPLAAADQKGDPRTLAEFSGKWVFLDFCAAWCGPCRFMGSESQAVQDAFDNSATAPPFQYVATLLESPTHGPSALADAQNWAGQFGIGSVPVLHNDGAAGGPVSQWFASAGFAVVPSGVIVDPAGVIRAYTSGYRSPAQLVHQIGVLAGVSDGDLPDPPDPPPPAHLSDALVEIRQPGTGSTSFLDQVGGNFQLQYFDFAPLSGLAHPIATISTAVSGGVETLDIAVFDLDLTNGSSTNLGLATPWSVSLANPVWTDGLPRRRSGALPVTLSLIYLSGGQLTEFPTGITVPDTLAGSSVRFGFEDLSSIPGRPANVVGFDFRGLQVEVDLTAAALGVMRPSPAAGVALAAPRPNPARNGTTLQWTQARAGVTGLEVYDLAGRLVRRLASGTQSAGEHERRWDLLDESGRRVAPGVYLARLWSEGEARGTRRVVVLE